MERLRQEHTATAFVMATEAGAWLLRSLPARLGRALPSFSPQELKVDVTVLHKIVLEGVFGLSEDGIREQRHLHYFRESEEALTELDHHANAVFLLNPLPLPLLRDLCYAGKVLPQKSTDFYPKLLTGFINNVMRF